MSTSVPVSPLSYPTAPHQRKHSPAGYKDPANFKPWLRDDFSFRCVYCLFRERWYPNGSSAFGVEHVVPKSKDPSKACDYANLAYACNRCNSSRTDRDLPDPCSVPLGLHLTCNGDGIVASNTPEGRTVIDILGLNSPTAVDFRRRVERLRLLADAFLAEAFFGFPDELPDLSTLLPPAGNARPQGVRECAHARKARGELPSIY